MSYSSCIYGGPCTGCMECQEEKIHTCEECGDEIESDDVYEVDGRTLCRHCVLDLFKVSA